MSTGKKVNSALDNPINFFTASGLRARANDLGRLLDSIGNAVQTLQAADKGITAITKLVEIAKATAKQALIAPEAHIHLRHDDHRHGSPDADGDVAAVPAGDLTVQVNGVTAKR